MKLPCATPIGQNSCGSGTRCVAACPAKALKGNAWHPGIPREELLDVQACDQMFFSDKKCYAPWTADYFATGILSFTSTRKRKRLIATMRYKMHMTEQHQTKQLELFQVNEHVECYFVEEKKEEESLGKLFT